jgi:soluble lytic murein transglycosylase
VVTVSSKLGSIAMHVLSRILFFGFVLGVLQPLPGGAALQDPLADQRGLFLEAREALNRGQRERLRQLAARIPDYPLQPYLRFWELQRYLSAQTDRDIAAFLEDHPDTSLSRRLRTAWLHRLAGQKAWARFLAFYEEPQGVELQCHALRAQLADAARRDAVLDQAEQLWLVGQSQPGACDPVFDLLYASTRMTSTLIWERIRLAMDAGRLELASFLAKKLSAEDRGWVRHWTDMHRRPAQMLADPALRAEGPIAREIIHHGLIRLARHDPDQAFTRWETLRDQHGFESEEAAVALRRMAMSAAFAHHPRALEWLNQVPASAADDTLHQWRIRSALANGEWATVLDAYQGLSSAERDKTEWRYWRARALHARGKSAEAMEAFAALARERDYHGFLAADRLDWQYAMNHEPIAASDAELDELERHPGVLRARELYRAGLITDARREWYALTNELPPRDLELAARLAYRWGWHDRAILTTARAAHYSDLDLRFPLLHKQEVMNTAKQQQLDPALIFGVIRQESAFMQDARSPAGALGLMQLMPATGRMTARQERIPLANTQALLQTDKNILLGGSYLRRMLNEFDGNPALATAAYNAGPHRVKRWRPEAEQSADVWVDRIPFHETRNYVRNVLAYSAIFEYRLERPVTRLQERLPDIKQAQP